MKNCGFKEELVSYIYGELEEAERKRFEEHLLVCETCVSELEAFGEVRLAVLQWRQNDFENLPTPEIRIPESLTQKVLSVLFGFFREEQFSRKWLVFASACLLMVLSLFVFNERNGNEEIASSVPVAREELTSVDESVITTKDEPIGVEEQVISFNGKVLKREDADTSIRKRVNEKAPLGNQTKENKEEQSTLESVEMLDPLDLPDLQEMEAIRLVDLFDEIGGI